MTSVGTYIFVPYRTWHVSESKKCVTETQYMQMLHNVLFNDNNFESWADNIIRLNIRHKLNINSSTDRAE